MSLVIVPDSLRAAIYAKVDAAIKECPDAAADRELFYRELLSHYNEHGSIPDFTLAKRDTASEVRQFLAQADGRTLGHEIIRALVNRFGLTPEAAGRAIAQYAQERANGH